MQMVLAPEISSLILVKWVDRGGEVFGHLCHSRESQGDGVPDQDDFCPGKRLKKGERAGGERVILKSMSNPKGTLSWSLFDSHLARSRSVDLWPCLGLRR